MSKNKLWIVIAAVLGIALAITGYWGFRQAEAKENLQNIAENNYKRAFNELVSHVEKVEANTSKALVVSSPVQVFRIFSDIWREAFSAKENFSQLPIPQHESSRTEVFLTQLADFTYVLGQRNLDGVVLSEKEFKMLEELHKQATRLGEALNGIQNKVNEDELRWIDVKNITGAELKKVKTKYLVDGFQMIEHQMEEYPTLVYDGPFSDNMRPKPLGITGDKIALNDAAKIACAFVGEQRAKQYNVEKAGEGNGVISTYSIQMVQKDNRGPAIALDITKKGGHVVWMLDARNVDEVTLDGKAAEKRAAEFLEQKGYKDMVMTSIIAYQKIALVSYAYEQEGVIIYPDHVKIKVALDNGEILGFDAMGYLMAHHKRTIPKPKLTSEQAAEKLTDRLNVLRERLTFIPLETQKEVLCYEFKANLGQEQYLVYINAETGEQERILRIVETPEGTLTI